jgi:hypothetical protein
MTAIRKIESALIARGAWVSTTEPNDHCASTEVDALLAAVGPMRALMALRLGDLVGSVAPAGAR